MSTERTFEKLSGIVTIDQKVYWPRVNYPRLATLEQNIASGQTPASEMDAQLILDDVPQAGEIYKLPAGQKAWDNIIGGSDGVVIPANVTPGLVVTAHGGAIDVATWLTSTVTQAADQTGPWVTLTSSDLQSRISAPEYNLFSSSLLMTGQADPIPQILESITNLVRGYVQGNPQNTLGLEGSLPKQLVDPALVLAKQRLFERVTALKNFAAAMEKPVADANQLLRDVAKGIFRISVPTTVTTEIPQGGASPKFTGRTPTYGRTDQDGI